MTTLKIAPYVLLVALVATGFIVYGRYNYKEGQRDFLAQIEKARVASAAEKEKIDHEISTLDDDELLLRALKWVRNSDR